MTSISNINSYAMPVPMEEDKALLNTVDTDTDDEKASNIVDSQVVEAVGADTDSKPLGNLDYALMLLFGVNSSAYQKSLTEYLNMKVDSYNTQKENITNQMNEIAANITVDNANKSNADLGSLQSELNLVNNELNEVVSFQLDNLTKSISADQKMGQRAANNLIEKLSIPAHRNN